MRARWAIGGLTVWLLAAVPAFPAQGGQIAIGAQVGWVEPIGALLDVARGAVGVGANIAYGVTDWLAVELDGVYGRHDERDEARSGDLRLDLIHAAAGPRFTLRLPVVSLWATVGIGVTGYSAAIEYRDAADEKKKESDSGAAVAASGAVGVDFRLSDLFELGIVGRGTWGLTDLDLPTPTGTDAVRPFVVAPMVRASILF
jgi:hypothetical protein